MKIRFKYKNKKVEIRAEKCKGIKKFTGLMFKSKKTNALLFDFDNKTNQAIHSLFCPDFLALWLNKNKIVDKKIIACNKFLIKPKEKFSKLIEIPINKKYEKIIKLLLDGDRKGLNTVSS